MSHGRSSKRSFRQKPLPWHGAASQWSSRPPFLPPARALPLPRVRGLRRRSVMFVGATDNRKAGKSNCAREYAAWRQKALRRGAGPLVWRGATIRQTGLPGLRLRRFALRAAPIAQHRDKSSQSGRKKGRLVCQPLGGCCPLKTATERTQFLKIQLALTLYLCYHIEKPPLEPHKMYARAREIYPASSRRSVQNE